MGHENGLVHHDGRPGKGRRFLLCSDGPWDTRKFLAPECRRKRIALPACWDRFVDIRQSFKQAFNVRHCNVNKMLAHRGLRFEGRPHSGIDDTRNIARILAEVLRAGHSVTPEMTAKMHSQGRRGSWTHNSAEITAPVWSRRR